MRIFERILVVSVLLSAGLGCGGSAGLSGSGNSPYTGVYQGEYLQSSDGTYGTVNLTIGTSGSITGTSVQSNGSNKNTLAGTISSSGSASITSSSNPTAATGTFTAPTTSTIEAALTQGANTVWITLVVNPSPPVGGGNAFDGEYSGTVADTTKSTTGIIVFSINSAGALSGSVLVSNNGSPELGTVAGTVSDQGVANYTMTTGSTTFGVVTGVFNIANGQITSSGLKNTTSGDSLSLTVTQLS